MHTGDADGTKVEDEPECVVALALDADCGKAKQRKRRLLFLHEMHTLVGAIDLCTICKATVPYVEWCAQCAGLRLDLPAEEFWYRLASEAADNDIASDGEQIGNLVGEEVATPRLRWSTRSTTTEVGQVTTVRSGVRTVVVLVPRRQVATRS